MDSGYRNEHMCKNLSSSTCYICTFKCIGYTLIENLEKNSIFKVLSENKLQTRAMGRILVDNKMKAQRS